MKFYRISPPDNAWLVFALISCALLICAPSGRSLWIDESWSAHLIMISNLPHLWHIILHDDCGMPVQFGHTLTGFLFGKFFGYSEQGLRMANLVWAFIGVGAFTMAGRKLKIPWLPLVYAASPFVWLYVDEIRPYAMQTSAGSWMMVAFLYIISPDASARSRTVWTNVFWFSCFVVYAASVLGGFAIAAACFVVLTTMLRSKQFPNRGVWLSTIIWFIPLVALTASHAYFTAVEGHTASRQWTPGPLNVAFALYEMSGLMGWGPPRDAIRAAAKEGGLNSLIHLFLPSLIGLSVYISVLALGAFGIVKEVTQKGVKRAPALWLAAVVALGLLFMFLAAIQINWPFWGRHVSPLFPFAAVALALGFLAYGNLGRVCAGVWIALMLLASLHGRFLQGEHTDDYRSASRVAAKHLADGEVVWWSAETLTPNYYHVFPADAFDNHSVHKFLPVGPSAWPKMPATNNNQCYSVLGLTQVNLEQLPLPTVVVASKPDVWDQSGELRRWLDKGGFEVIETYPAFQVWKQP